jgi:hypothetical protein
MGCDGVEICGYLFASAFVPMAIGTKADEVAVCKSKRLAAFMTQVENTCAKWGAEYLQEIYKESLMAFSLPSALFET